MEHAAGWAHTLLVLGWEKQNYTGYSVGPTVPGGDDAYPYTGPVQVSKRSASLNSHQSGPGKETNTGSSLVYDSRGSYVCLDDL